MSSISVPAINLPIPIQIHAFGLVGLGIYLTFSPSAHPKTSNSPMLGIASMGLGLGYLSTAYMPIEENQWLHASVPVRIILALVAGLKLAIGGPALGRGATRELMTTLVYDGIGGLVLGWWLGRWDGRVSGY
ncbi:hypothetical protein BOTBODRAFT_30946 [Botryobasidium botryosum FD-172 SS1]|uniref:Uncharacterized protein n=1 Tax=Botryobasidium botryosum (strain FD-172 SS1) TaxID=930990 RepID=A0A067MNC8_BOTB1|nr:hypothetical protein BOTBODRAFT_30946 [Botryobasidium botryosum FD-172 SS1]